jgi:hypothetical protein
VWATVDTGSSDLLIPLAKCDTCPFNKNLGRGTYTPSATASNATAARADPFDSGDVQMFNM